jgi:hypothetical protein
MPFAKLKISKRNVGARVDVDGGITEGNVTIDPVCASLDGPSLHLRWKEGGERMSLRGMQQSRKNR